MATCSLDREGNVINHLRAPGFQSGEMGSGHAIQGPQGKSTWLADRVEGRQRKMELSWRAIQPRVLRLGS